MSTRLVISRGMIEVYRCLKSGKWLGVREVARDCPRLNPSSVPRLLRKLRIAGVLEHVEMHPDYRYRLAVGPSAEVLELIERLEATAAALRDAELP